MLGLLNLNEKLYHEKFYTGQEADRFFDGIKSQKVVANSLNDYLALTLYWRQHAPPEPDARNEREVSTEANVKGVYEVGVYFGPGSGHKEGDEPILTQLWRVFTRSEKRLEMIKKYYYKLVKQESFHFVDTPAK